MVDGSFFLSFPTDTTSFLKKRLFLALVPEPSPNVCPKLANFAHVCQSQVCHLDFLVYVCVCLCVGLFLAECQVLTMIKDHDHEGSEGSY